MGKLDFEVGFGEWWHHRDFLFIKCILYTGPKLAINGVLEHIFLAFFPLSFCFLG